MLPALQKGQELQRRDRLNLAPQAADGEAVDAGEDAPVAPLDFERARGKVAAEHLAFGFQLRQRDVDRLQRTSEVWPRALGRRQGPVLSSQPRKMAGTSSTRASRSVATQNSLC